ncbi:MAG: response regulator [Gammaproteobacteria bacterium]|nr:response regulator [Gammaproteobacteria bacterium]
MTKPLKKILYVEDEPDIAAIAQIALVDIGGFELKYCNSGSLALAAIEGFKPDLFLIDVMMPEMDGTTLLKEIRKIPAYEQTPIIFMTAKTQAAEVKEYKALGAIDVITKPFDPMQLAQKITEIWDHHYA